jgi:hypothetical protein
MATTFEQAVDQCLRSSQPLLDLRNLLDRYLQQGVDANELLSRLEKVRQQYRTAEREADEDTVTEVMDFLVGWCSPHMKLTMPPHQASEPQA